MKTLATNIDYVRQALRDDAIESEKAVKIIRPFFAPEILTYDVFIEFIIKRGTTILNRLGKTGSFKPQDQHEFTLCNLHKYLIGDPSFEVKEGIPGDLHKGIILGGLIGCGKTTLLTAFLEVFEYLGQNARIVVKFLQAENMADAIKAHGIDSYTKGMLMVDDICREASLIKEWGNVIKPFISLIGKRFYTSHLTFGTTNYRPEVIHDYYGPYTSNRLFSLCNYMWLKGDSLRSIQANIQLKLNIDNPGVQY